MELNSMKNEIKNTVGGINNRINEAEKQISELKIKWWKPLSQKRKQVVKRKEDSL